MRVLRSAMLALTLVAPSLAAQTAAEGQRTSATNAVESPFQAPSEFVLPANTIVELEMTDRVGSGTSKTGDMFRMRVAVAVTSGDTVLIPANTLALGQVVHAARAGAGGKGGELILAARYLDLPQGQVRLRSSLGAAGKDRTKASLAVNLLAGPFSMIVKGKQVEVPAGSPLSARLATATSFTIAR